MLVRHKNRTRRALYLDDLRSAPPGWEIVRSADRCIAELAKGDVAFLSLDHDLGEGTLTGYDLAKLMVEKNLYPTEAIYIHTDNPSGRQNMAQILRHYAPENIGVYHYPCPRHKGPDVRKEALKVEFDMLPSWAKNPTPWWVWVYRLLRGSSFTWR